LFRRYNPDTVILYLQHAVSRLAHSDPAQLALRLLAAVSHSSDVVALLQPLRVMPLNLREGSSSSTAAPVTSSLAKP
jgi:hypothetical protein